MIKMFQPWPAGEKCNIEGYDDFSEALERASDNFTAPISEWKHARSKLQIAVSIAIREKWPYWVMERMFNEINPHIEWRQFMGVYVSEMHSLLTDFD